MIVCLTGGGKGSDATPPQFQTTSNTNDSLAQVLVPTGSPSSAHVVIVMDALKEFSWEPLHWALDNVVGTGYSITLLGVMPWTPLALSLKTWLDVWTFDLGDLSALKVKGEWKNDQKSQKIRGIMELCEQKGVVPSIKVAIGHPLKLVVLEKTTSLHATFVVIDRHLKKNKAFYADRLPSSAVMMKSNGGVDALRIRSTDLSLSTPGESPATILPTPQVILSEKLSELLRSPSPRIREQALGNEKARSY